MFGTMGFSELIIILVIVLIIFGAGRLPQIGEGVGKALKGFKKEVQDIPPPVDPQTQSDPTQPSAEGSQSAAASAPPAQAQGTTPSSPATPSPANQPYRPGPELTPGTTAALLYKGAGPEHVQPRPSPTGQEASAQQTAASHVPPPVTMEQRASQTPPTSSGAQYPPLPPSAKPKPHGKRPSAIVNKAAVARVQAQQAALKAKSAKADAPAPQDMQSLGEGLGSALRTFRDAAADIKNSVDPEMRTIQAELEQAEKEMRDTVESAKHPLQPKEPPSTT